MCGFFKIKFLVWVGVGVGVGYFKIQNQMTTFLFYVENVFGLYLF